MGAVKPFHIIIVVILLAGLGVGLYLVGNPTRFLPRAASDPLEPSPSAISGPVTPSPITLVKPVISRAPGAFSTTNCHGGKPYIDFYWSDVPQAEYYVIERLDRPGQEFGRVYHPVQSFVDQGLEKTTTYQYRVKAVAQGVFSPPSDVFTLVTAGTVCIETSILSINQNICANGRWNFSLNWNSDPSASNYSLTITQLGESSAIQTVASNSYIHTPNVVNQQYTYSVKSNSNSPGSKASSNVVKIKSESCQAAASPSPSPSSVPGCTRDAQCPADHSCKQVQCIKAPCYNQCIKNSPSPSTSGIETSDLNGNGVVDIFDFNELVTTFGQTGSNLPADLNKNGKVDIFDFNALVNQLRQNSLKQSIDLEFPKRYS